MEFDSLSGYSNVPAYTPPEPKTVETRPQSTGETSVTQESAAPDRSIHQERNSELGVAYDEWEKHLSNKNDQSSVEDMMGKAVEQANKKLAETGREFSFAVHEKTRQVMVKVINSETKEVVREIPPQKALDALAKMWELAGILVDEKR